MVEEDGSTTQDELDELDDHLAFLSRKYSKLEFKRNSAAPKPFRLDFQQGKNLIDRSKFKCYNYGITGHLSSECRKPKAEKREKPSEAVDYKKKYFDLLK